MSVFITSAYSNPTPDYGPKWLRENATEGLSMLTERPEHAELIIFVEVYQPNDLFYSAVQHHELFQRFSQRCLLYHNSDHALPFCRTLTPSNDRRNWGIETRRSFHYIARLFENSAINTTPLSDAKPSLLFSFAGSMDTHPVRKKLLSLASKESMIIDTGVITHHNVPTADIPNYEQRYAELIQASHFVLCPRGFGPCSYRLFEVMQLGRVPVIIADDWAPIPGIPWTDCAIFVSESEIHLIPDLLLRYRERAHEMGCNARRIWENHFAPNISLIRLIEACRDLSAIPYTFTNLLTDGLNLLQPPYRLHALNRIKESLH